jgi:DNA-directed RNA polymerase subunit RPC12/RpoP
MGYVCQSCGGEIVADEHTAATACPFCGNPVVMTGNVSGSLKPDLVIPFQVDKKAAKEALKKHYSGKRLLPCSMGFDTFFIDPYGDVMPCNGSKEKWTMGNLNTQSWEELWNSSTAKQAQQKVCCCDRNCWMIGSASPAMRRHILRPALWVAAHKLRSLLGIKAYSMYENGLVRAHRDGHLTKEELDRRSTADRSAYERS